MEEIARKATWKRKMNQRIESVCNEANEELNLFMCDLRMSLIVFDARCDVFHRACD